jgi:hypothetical protein
MARAGGAGGGGGGVLSTKGRHCHPPRIVVPQTLGEALNMAAKFAGNSRKSACMRGSDLQKQSSPLSCTNASQHADVTRLEAPSAIDEHPAWIIETIPLTSHVASIVGETMAGDMIDGGGDDDGGGGGDTGGGKGDSIKRGIGAHPSPKRT